MSGSHDAEGIPFPSHGLSLADQRKALELQTAERIAALLKEREDLEKDTDMRLTAIAQELKDLGHKRPRAKKETAQ